MKVRVPASSANLGPGFDTLALALSLYVSVEVRPGSELRIISHGTGSELDLGHDHLAARVVKDVLGHDNVTIEIDSEIPLARGLGSSAALAVAAAASVGAYDAFVVAAGFDGHGENAGASYLGGLVAAAKIGDSFEAVNFAIDPRLATILIVPNLELSTSDARRVLPESIALSDAVFNLQRMALLLSGLADLNYLRREFGYEKIHEISRETIFPLAKVIKELLLDNGAIIATWSGAGTSVIGLYDRYEAHERIHVIKKILSDLDIDATALLLEVDLDGMTVASDDELPEFEVTK